MSFLQSKITEYLVGIIYMAILTMLVAPGSTAATTIQSIFTVLESLVKTAAGYSTSTTSNTTQTT
jgi:hypothetical protein